MKKKKEYASLSMIGTFFDIDYMEEMKSVVLEKDNDSVELLDFYRNFFSVGDMKKYEYLKTLVLVNINSTMKSSEEKDVEGFFVGILLDTAPEHLSIKRIKIDLRTYFEEIGAMSKEEEIDAIGIIERVVCI